VLAIAYSLLHRREVYRELGAEYFDRLDRERTSVWLVQRLERLGFAVTLTAPPHETAQITAGP
jgi:hypothetical protein